MPLKMIVDPPDYNSKPHTCPVCNGLGLSKQELEGGDKAACKTCKGHGIVWPPLKHKDPGGQKMNLSRS